MTSAQPENQFFSTAIKRTLQKVCLKKDKGLQSKPVRWEKLQAYDTPKRSRHWDHTSKSSGKHYNNCKCYSVHEIDHCSSDCSDQDNSNSSYSPCKPQNNLPSRSKHYKGNSIFYIADVDAATSDQVWVDLVNRNSIKFMAKIDTGAK